MSSTRVDERSKDPGDDDGDDLGDQQRRIAIDQSDSLPIGHVVDGPRGKYAREYSSERSADTVHPERIERIVVAEFALQRRARQEADDAGGDSDDQSRHRLDKTGGGRDSDQTRHGPRTRPQHAGLAPQTPFHRGPGQGSGRGREMCGRKRTRRQTVGSQGTAGVKAEPAHPQHRSAQRSIRQVVRGHRFRSQTEPLANHQGEMTAPKRRN